VIPVVESTILELRGDADVCVNPNVAIPPSTIPVWQPFDSCYLSKDQTRKKLKGISSRLTGSTRYQKLVGLSGMGESIYLISKDDANEFMDHMTISAQ